MKIRIFTVALVVAVALVIASTQSSQRQRQVSLVVTNGAVVTMDGGGRVIVNRAVAIDGSDIVAVGAADAIQRDFRGSETIDAGGQVVLPGLINTHTTRRWSCTAALRTTWR